VGALISAIVPELQRRAGEALDEVLVGLEQLGRARMLLNVFPRLWCHIERALALQMHRIGGVHLAWPSPTQRHHREQDTTRHATQGQSQRRQWQVVHHITQGLRSFVNMLTRSRPRHDTTRWVVLYLRPG
jgi:hypothetical protein